jgi:protein-S-isoprenylcysteine O-methyltransferase Ste14
MNSTPQNIAQKIAPAIGPDQTMRKAVLFGALGIGIVFLFIGGARWPGGDWRHEGIEAVGLGLIVLCILGRTWCSLYIGGRKNELLIADGPYSVCRNPLYFFSIIGAVGVGAQVGSLVIALFCGFVAWAVFVRTALREEAALGAAFGDDYRAYLVRVPRFLPKPSLWRDLATVEVRPRVVLMTFVDALVFLAALPLAEGLEYVHEAGLIPVFLTLP